MPVEYMNELIWLVSRDNLGLGIVTDMAAEKPGGSGLPSTSGQQNPQAGKEQGKLCRRWAPDPSLTVGVHRVEQGRKWYQAGTAWARAGREENAEPLQGLRKTPCGTYACVSTWGKDEAGGIEEPNVQSHTATTSEKGTLGKVMPKAAPSPLFKIPRLLPRCQLAS